MASDPIFTAGKKLPAADLRTLATTGTYTPSLTASTTNPNLGSGGSFAQDGEYHYSGRFVVVEFNLTFGTTGPTAGTGSYQIGLPTGFDLDATWSSLQIPVGGVRIQDSSGGTVNFWQLRGSSTSATFLVATKEDGTTLTNAVPWTWAAGDSLRGRAVYLTDP